MSAIRLLGGVLLLAALALASSHSHENNPAESTQCLVCQVVGLHLDSQVAVPSPPVPTAFHHVCQARPFEPEAASPALTRGLPRAPPALL